MIRFDCGRLRDLRRAHGLKQTELAKMLGVNQATLSRWESGASMPNASVLESIMGIFEVNPNSLFVKEIKGNERQ